MTALPHDAVDAAHFYKHIEGEGLPEPRRMKQLLTWCATRALGKKPSGSRSEDESARLAGTQGILQQLFFHSGWLTWSVAARVIQEELLKDVGSRSELSDWFGREETTPPPVVVKKPNPKNVHNADKIKELEDHIQKYDICLLPIPFIALMFLRVDYKLSASHLLLSSKPRRFRA